MRTLIDLPENAVKALDAIGANLDLSRAELVRRSVNAYLEKHDAAGTPIKNDIYGLYSDIYAQDTDSLEIQQALRAEWDEPVSINANFTLQDSGDNTYDDK